MQEKIKQEKIPIIHNKAKEDLVDFDPELETQLKRLVDLPDKLQDDIINDISTHRIAGMKPEELVERLEVLITKSHQLDWMDSHDSDKVHQTLSTEERINEERIELFKEIAADKAREKKQEPPSTIH